ncbi:hypothetical protein M8C21_016771 [Ambrosia artemisiifolia]|uniref:Uncharacterized protein n=1 Tax=Ambrosia artemisiifolia TaxID=4212 RepID=A0AAD5D2M2_AMBAR|nr:hypothetical protein M8C21_016771 [Ambrosia artemisiifolia]
MWSVWCQAAEKQRWFVYPAGGSDVRRWRYMESVAPPPSPSFCFIFADGGGGFDCCCKPGYEGGGSSIVSGQSLDWIMAAIYMGRRIPQIVLNIKRGSVEVRPLYLDHTFLSP